MKNAPRMSLKSFEDIFSTEETRQEEKREKVTELPLSELHPFKDHPFRVVDDDTMRDTAESIKEYGVLVPIIARPAPEGDGYEIVSGHRRHRASELAGKETIPVLIRELDDDEATIIMIDSNLQRENILPSERAKAYKMKLDAIKHQGERRDLTSDPMGQRLKKNSFSIHKVAEEAGDSKTQVQRFIRLTYLKPELSDLVDQKKLNFQSAVELSYLSPQEQDTVITTIESEGYSPSIAQAQELRKLSQSSELNDDTTLSVFTSGKKEDPRIKAVPESAPVKPQEYVPKENSKQSATPQKRVLTIEYDRLNKYFKGKSEQEMLDTIFRLLDKWQRMRTKERGMSR